MGVAKPDPFIIALASILSALEEVDRRGVQKAGKSPTAGPISSMDIFFDPPFRLGVAKEPACELCLPPEDEDELILRTLGKSPDADPSSSGSFREEASLRLAESESIIPSKPSEEVDRDGCDRDLPLPVDGT